MQGKKEDDPKAIRKRRSTRVSDYDMEKIIRKYGSFTNFVNACILEKIRSGK